LHNKYLLISVNSPISYRTRIHTFLIRPSLIVIPIHREQSRTIIIVPGGQRSAVTLAKRHLALLLSLRFSRNAFVTVLICVYFFFSSPRLILSSALNHARKSREISLARSRTARSRLNSKTTRTSCAVRPRPPVRRRCVQPMASPHSGESFVFARERASIAKSRAASPDSEGGTPPGFVGPRWPAFAARVYR